jgi:hypothetical protein
LRDGAVAAKGVWYPPPVDPAASATPEVKKGWASWSTSTRVLVVLAVLVGGGIGLMMIAMIAGVLWLVIPGDQAPSAAAIAPDSGGFVQLHADIDDPGIGAMLVRAQQADSLPKQLRFLAELQRSQTQQGFELLWPRDVTVAFDRGDPDQVTAVINLRRLGGGVRLFYFFMEQAVEERGDLHRYRGHPIQASSDGGVAVSHSGSSILVAQDREAMERMIDRIVDQTPPPIPPELRALSERLADGSDLHAVFGAGLPGLADDLPEGAIEHAGASIDVVSQDEIRGTLLAVAAPGRDAEVDAALQAWAEQLVAYGSEQGLTVRARASREAGALRIDLEALGVAEAVGRAIDRAMEEAKESTP